MKSETRKLTKEKLQKKKLAQATKLNANLIIYVYINCNTKEEKSKGKFQNFIEGVA